MNSLPENENILTASPAYIRVAAIVSIALTIVGLFVSFHVYFALPHPQQVSHLNRWGEVIVEPFEQYIFVFAAFQVVVALAVSVQALRWRSVLQRLADQERAAKARYPRMREANATVLYKLTSFLVCLTQVILWGATLWRALRLTTNNL
jgi:hypothetical protein